MRSTGPPSPAATTNPVLSNNDVGRAWIRRSSGFPQRDICMLILPQPSSRIAPNIASKSGVCGNEPASPASFRYRRFARHPNTAQGTRVTSSRPGGIILIVSAEFDRLIHEKRSQLRDAFAAYQKAREAVAHAQIQLVGFVRADEPDSTHIAPEVLRDSQAEIGRLESEVRDAATRFNAVSDELAQLHRGKYGEWHVTWRGPLPSR